MSFKLSQNARGKLINLLAEEIAFNTSSDDLVKLSIAGFVGYGSMSDSQLISEFEIKTDISIKKDLTHQSDWLEDELKDVAGLLRKEYIHYITDKALLSEDSFVVNQGGEVNGTSLKGYFLATYADLVNTFGKPILNTDGDTSSYEWVFSDIGDISNVYTLYTDSQLDEHEFKASADVREWSVCGKEYAGEFVEWLTNKLKKIS